MNFKKLNNVFERSLSLLMLGLALVALFGVSLPGCSSNRGDSQTSEDRNRAAIIASDSPSPFHTADSSEKMDYDPWESFNAKTFSLNFNYIDHYGLKPAAKVWSDVFPQQVRHSLANAFYNLAMPVRFVNQVLQTRFPAAGEEIARFVVNTTVGVAGLFDPASHLGLKKNQADSGETLALYGVKPGPYLVLPLLQPLTVRDAFGYAADSLMDPLSWFVTPIGADFGRSAAYQINERAENMTMYDDVEDTSLDLYAAVRNGYLQRRRKAIRDAIHDRDQTWRGLADHFEPQRKSILIDDPQSSIAPANQTARSESLEVEAR
ncbi:MAG TPA: VacJ family lipoprotein [Sporolactobacillaceae bacterium]|nr:VacJ family lipoprotein [Sporolactobacillaceae bacterium]